MTERTEALLADLLEVQRRALANQETALANQTAALESQRLAVARQLRALRLVFLLVGLVAAAVLLPYAWQWVVFLRAP